jgi:hypothetical protein
MWAVDARPGGEKSRGSPAAMATRCSETLQTRILFQRKIAATPLKSLFQGPEYVTISRRESGVIGGAVTKDVCCRKGCLKHGTEGIGSSDLARNFRACHMNADGMSADWIAAIGAAESDCRAVGQIHVEGLEISIATRDPSPLNWALRSLEPLSLVPNGPIRRRYRIVYIQSDDIVLSAIRSLSAVEVIPPRMHKRGGTLWRARPAAALVVYCDPGEGILWLCNLADDTVHMVVSSRTSLPALSLASLTRTIITRYLETDGWTIFHAGAVETGAGVLMLVGHAGAGKTSLLMALLAGGARYISNERVFVRREGDVFRVLGFPMAVAVGLGTALQFPQLAPLIEVPDRLVYPRRRFKAERVAETARDDWPGLDDKLQLLPWELAELFAGPAAVAGGTLRGIVIPQAARGPADVVITALPADHIVEMLSSNLFEAGRDGAYPPWMEMNFPPYPEVEDDDDLHALARVSAVRFSFGLSRERLAEVQGYVPRLLEATA